jgi:hypothetical protein
VAILDTVIKRRAGVSGSDGGVGIPLGTGVAQNASNIFRKAALRQMGVVRIGAVDMDFGFGYRA